MGRDKADIEINGSSMLQLVHEAVDPYVATTVLVGAEREGYTCWPDAIHGEGPLTGIATALSRTEHDHVFVIAVDQPFVRSTTIKKLIDLAGPSPTVPVDTTGVRQVTCSLYPASIADAALAEAKAGGSVQSLLDAVSFDAVTPDVWQTWGEDGRSWFSINLPEQLRIGIERYTQR